MLDYWSFILHNDSLERVLVSIQLNQKNKFRILLIILDKTTLNSGRTQPSDRIDLPHYSNSKMEWDPEQVILAFPITVCVIGPHRSPDNYLFGDIRDFVVTSISWNIMYLLQNVTSTSYYKIQMTDVLLLKGVPLIEV